MSTLEERVAALEAQVAALVDGPVEPTTKAAGAFWALQGLRRRIPATGPGAVLYTGVVEATPGERYEWQYGLPVEGLLADDWSERATTLSALAHPVRLVLMREILTGRHSAAELADVEGLGTSGQLYHHLRQLVGAGWLRSGGRGQYTVPGERVVPLLVILAAVTR